MTSYYSANTLTLPEIVMELREQIERLLPGWRIWARLDIADFQFFGWKGSIRNCVFSECYRDSVYYSPQTIADYMSESLRLLQQMGDNGRNL